MATRQRRLEIVIAWMQQHPGVVANVQTRLRSLAGTYGYLRANVGQLNLTQEEQAAYMKELSNIYNEMRVSTGASQQTVNMMNKALKAAGSEMEKAAAPAEKVRARVLELGESYRFLLGNIDKMDLSAEDQIKFANNLTSVFEKMRDSTQMGAITSAMYNKALKATTAETGKAATVGNIFDRVYQRMGYRTSWIGFRMMIMGRIITRSVLQPMQQMIGALTGWDKSMETVALALALQEAGMGETGLTAEELRSTLEDLAKTGMSTQTAMAGLQSTWIALAEENAPALNSILGTIQEAIEGVGGAIITSMVDTIADVIPSIGDFIDSLGPMSDEIGTAAGYLLLVGVALSGIGAAIYLMKPALLILKGLFSPVTLVVLELIAVLLILKKIIEAWPSEVERIKEMWKYAGVPVSEIPEDVYKYKSRREMWFAARGEVEAPAEAPVRGLGGAGVREAMQDIDIDVSIDIENMLGEVDVDAMVKKISDEMAEKLRLRGFP